MAKKNKADNRPKNPTMTPEPTQPTAEVGEATSALFPKPRKIALWGVLLILWCALMVLLAQFNLLIAPKIVIGWLLGLGNPADLGPAPGSGDLALLLAALGAFVYCAWIHPVIGVSFLALLRTWLDGYTFPIDNHYFLWGILVCFAIWAGGALLRGEPLRFRVPLSLLGGFLILAWILAPSGHNPGVSYRLLVIWAGYLFLFGLVANGVRSRRVWLLSVSALLLTYFAQNFFSIFQYHYLLPYLRVLLDQRPELLQNFFGTSEFTPELANRLNRNRAFGTMLFPNAMAGFLVLGIPLALAAAWQSWQRFRSAWPRAATASPADNTAKWSMAVLSSVAIFFLIAFLIQFPALYALGAPAWYADLFVTIGIAALVAALVGGVVHAFTANYGVGVASSLLALISTSALSITLVYGLAITYSRGAMAALMLALLALAVLVFIRRKKILAFAYRIAPPVAALLVISIAVVGAWNALAQAPDAATEQPPGATRSAPSQPFVTQEGVNLSLEDMADPSTLRLRLDYWRVGMRIFQHNWLTGVGLGNFQWAYPLHQRLGEGDVREAHNSFLQLFTETGVLGGFLMLLFWAYVFWWGLRQILHQKDADARFWCAAIWCGLLAFLLHAAIDINFQHPSLMFFALFMAGLLFATPAVFTDPGDSARPETKNAPPTQTAARLLPNLVLIATLIGAALVFGVSLRIHAREVALSRVQVLNIDSQKELRHRQAVMNFFFETVPEYGQKQAGNRPSIPTRSVLTLINEPEDIGKLGPIYVPTPGRAQGWRQLASGEVIPIDAQLLVERPWTAVGLARPYAEAWLLELERIDSRFPHDAELAGYITRQYLEMAAGLTAEKWAVYRKEALVRAVRWAEKATARNPYFADLHALYAQAKSYRAWIETDPEKRVAAHASALDSLHRAAELAPNIPHYLGTLAATYENIARNYEKAGEPENAADAMKEAQKYRAQSKAIWQERIEKRLPI